MPVRTCEVCSKQFVQGRGRPARRCPEHQRYGGHHMDLRASSLAEAYGRPCARCGLPMQEGDELHLDHADGAGARDYIGFSHAACNLAAGGRLANRQRPSAAPVGVIDAPVPAPPRQDIIHRPGCRCAEKARSWGAWPSRCW